jgi:hypothetical protein
MDATFRWTIPQHYLALLKDSLRADGAERKVRSAQRTVVRRICSSRVVKHLAPHEFFVSFKQALGAAADDLRLPPGRERDELLSRLFSICVEEFFEESDRADAPPPENRIKSSLRSRFIANTTKLNDEDCRGAR